MYRHLFSFALLLALLGIAASDSLAQQPLPTVNIYQQLAPWQAFYNVRTDWPRSHGYKPFKRFEWDMLQRGWPDGNVPVGAYWQAFQQRQRMPRTTLDENWVNLGPYNHGGRARVIRFRPGNPSIMYAGAVSGGLFKSIDGGENWFPMTDGLPNLSVGCFEMDPSHPDTMYLGTGEGYYNGDAVLGIGLLKSTDGGESWSQTGISWDYNQGRSVLKLNIDPRNSNIVFASTQSGLMRSTDGAATFETVLTGDVKAVVRDPQNPDNMLAAPGHAWGNPANGIYRSTNGGVNWSRVTDGLPATDDIGRIVLAYCAQNSAVVYAGICGTFAFNGSQMIGIYRSLDGGVTWAGVTPAGTNHYSSQGWYDMALAVKPDNAQTVISSGLDGYRSTNAGNSWSHISFWNNDQGSSRYVHADHHEIVFHPTNFNEVWEVTDGGIFKSTNLGTTWVEKNQGFVTFQYYAMGNATLDSNLAYGGTQDNGTYRYHDSPNFVSVFGGDGGYSVVDYTNNNTVYVEWQNGHRSRSDNGGMSWNDINPGIAGDGAWVTPMLLDPFDHLTIYTTTTDGTVWKSTNQGRNSSWQAMGQTLGGNMQVLAASPVLHNRIYVGSEQSVYRWDLMSSRWTDVSGNLPDAWVTRIVPDLTSGSVVYVTLSGFGHGHVYKSTTGGSSWTNISGNLPDVPFQDVVVDLRESGTLYAGGDIGVYRTTDGGATWEIYGEGLPAARVDDMEMQSLSGMLRIATHGRGMWEIASGSVPFTLIAPNGGELVAPGDSLEFRWSGRSFGGDVQIEINRNYPSENWEPIIDITDNDGSEMWQVTAPAGDHIRFRISHLTQTELVDSSNADSRIVTPGLTLLWPGSGDTVLTGVRDSVLFARTLVPERLGLSINRNFPDGEWEPIGGEITADSVAMWTVQLPASNNARLRLASLDRPTIYDESDASFVIRAPHMTLTTPNGGEQIPAGTTVQILWSAPEHTGFMKIHVNRNYPDGTWEVVTPGVLNTGSYSWTTTGPAAEHCRIRVSTIYDVQSCVISAADFALTPNAAGDRPDLPTEYALHDPSPNPFNPVTTIAMDIPSQTRVEARVYNNAGQEVAVLTDQVYDAGRYQLNFDGSKQASGVYFIRVRAFGKTQILKAMLVK
jgi:photosystem II stability/assembly factor-like uncharacterized protein